MSGEISGVLSREKIIEERREEVVLSENSVPIPSKLGGKYENQNLKNQFLCF